MKHTFNVITRYGGLMAITAAMLLAGCDGNDSSASSTPQQPVIKQPAMSQAAPHTASEIWQLDSLTHIGGAAVAVLGAPQLVASPLGQVVRFNGDGERLLVSANPLGDAEEFTIEVLFKPDDAFALSPEPRFVHIEAADNPNRRITIELRLNDQQQWYLDAYIKSELSQHTLIDATKVHRVGQWYHAAITYQAREFISYVNGAPELQGEVDYLPIAAQANTSLGARMNQIHWFKGEIAALAVTPKKLAPPQFVLLPRLPAP